MLVLTRKVGETVVIPEHGIQVKVLRILGDRVSLGFVAPLSSRIYREEVLEVIKENGRRSDGLV